MPPLSPETLWLSLLVPLLLFAGWTYTAMVVTNSLPTIRGKAIVLLIAHPDDEAMFFAPTVIALARPELGNHVKILCLSNGNADGLGSTRKSEILTSAARLGLRSPSDVLVLDDPRFPDGPRPWPAEEISSFLSSLFLKSNHTGPNNSTSTGTSTTQRKSTITGSGSASTKPPETTISHLLTFDRTGVSSHPNHISLHHGARHFVASLTSGSSSGWQSPVTMYSLTSVNILRKYAGAFDGPFTLAWRAGGKIALGGKGKRGGDRERPERLMFVSGVGEWVRGVGAMVRAHRSQMVWFRWGWVGVGRYMVVNDLERVDV